jgi:hypothetical protein
MDLLRVGKYLVAGEVTETDGAFLTFRPRFRLDEAQRLLIPLHAGKIRTSQAFLINTEFKPEFVESSEPEDYANLVHESMLPFAVYGRSLDLGNMKLVSYSRSGGFMVEQAGTQSQVSFANALTCVQVGQAIALEALKPRIKALGLFEGLDRESVTESQTLLQRSLNVYLKVQPFRDITKLGEGTAVSVIGYYQGCLVIEADGEMVWRPIEEAEYYNQDRKDDDYYFTMDTDRDNIQDPLQALPSKPALAGTARPDDNWNVQPHQSKVSGHFSPEVTISNEDYGILCPLGESYVGTHGFEDDERGQNPEIHDVGVQPGNDPVSGGDDDTQDHLDDIQQLTVATDDGPEATPQDYDGEQGSEGAGVDDGVDEAKPTGDPVALRKRIASAKAAGDTMLVKRLTKHLNSLGEPEPRGDPVALRKRIASAKAAGDTMLVKRLTKHLNSLGEQRDYKKEYADYHGKPEQRKNRSTRNQARRKMELEAGDEREVDHSKPISQGGTNHKNNLKVVTREQNRSKGAKYEVEEGQDESAASMVRNVGAKVARGAKNQKIAQAIMTRISGGGEHQLADIARQLVGIHFKDIQRVARNMAKHGHINYDDLSKVSLAEGQLDRLLDTISEGIDLDHVLGGLANPDAFEEAYQEGIKKVFPDIP